MAIKGLSIPVFGKYNFDPETKTVTYTDGLINPHAIEYTLTPTATDANPLYGDNMIIENDKPVFNGGTLALGIDDMTEEVAAYINGAKIVEKTYGENGTASVIVYDDEQDAPFLGVGIIEEHQISNVNQYKAVIMKKVQFSNPENTATTRGSSVSWQTKTINGNVMRSEEEGEGGMHPWKEEAWFDAESEALVFLKAILGVAAASAAAVADA